jgi:hypothetical protein
MPRGIATFPLGSDKMPEVANFQRMGLPASTKLATRFAGSPALGFMCGRRNGVTVLDVDTTNERVLADALSRHGSTPLIARTASGKFHAYYRFNGERRRIRPWRGQGLAIDLLGVGGFAVAPPSCIEGGAYSFIQGSLDDLDRLPVMQDSPIAPLPREWASMREGGGRNEALFRNLGRAVRHVDDRDQLLDYARTQNEKFGEPMEDAEVVKVAESVWKMQCEGRNRFGQHGAWFTTNQTNRLIDYDQDAALLVWFLKANQGPDSIFMVANGLAEKFGWTVKRLANARKLARELGIIVCVCEARQRQPAQYKWGRLDRKLGEG